MIMCRMRLSEGVSKYQQLTVGMCEVQYYTLAYEM
jgi:hypothetical protein